MHIRTTIGFVAVVLLTSCAATPSATPQIVYVTPAPTAEPTLRPTPEPTPVPAASGWLPYLDHVVASAELFVDAFNDVAGATGAGDFAASAVAGQALADLAYTELAWLDANAPDPCYATVQAAYRRAVQHYADAGRYLVDGVNNMDADTLGLGVDQLTQGAAALDESTALLSQTGC